MILAFTWAPALAIGGAILAAGPIIIHILNRRRFRVLDWAAMRFLLDSRRRNRRRLRIEELLLLALRVALCALVGLALANIRGGSLLGLPGAPVAHVFVLDDSLSMGQQAGSETLFRRAAARVADAVGSLPPTDKVAFLSATQPEAKEFFGRFVFAQDLQADGVDRPLAGKARAVPALASLKANDLRAKLPEALAEAERLLAAEKDLGRHIVLVGDFRQTEFADPAAAEPLRKAFARLAAAGAEIALIDFGAPVDTNLTVEKVELLDKAVVAGLKAKFQATVRNYGTRPAEGASMTVQVGAAALPAVALPSVPPGEAVSRTFTYTFPEAGAAAVRVSVTADLLPADNAAALAVNVRDAVRILAVDGAPDATNPSAGAAFCLARALDPRSNGEFGQRCDVVAAANLADVNLDDYDAVLLANVADLPAGRDDAGRPAYPQLDALARYVRAGGGLAIFVGDRVNLDFYNGPLWADGSGLSPLRLAAPVPATPDPARFVRLRPDSIAAEPMLRVFTGPSAAFTRMVRFYTYMPAIEAAPAALAAGVGPAQVLARFDDRDGSPAAARRTFGLGTVLMWYSSADVRWTDWPKDLTFLPVVNDMVAAIARREGTAFDAPAGQAIQYALAPALADATSLTLTTPAYPAEDAQTLLPRIEGKRRTVEFASTRWAGVYDLRIALPDKTERRILFSRRFDPAEGNLAKADRAEIDRAVGVEHTYENGLAAAVQSGRTGDDKAYWWILLAAVLAGLGAESVLAQRLGHYSTATSNHKEISG